jgi:predicted ATPase
MAAPLFLSSMSLTNFRGFKSEARVPLASLTFLVGPNSAGKSSLFAAVGLLAQSDIELQGPLLSEVSWSGRLVDAGSFSDVVFGHRTNLTIKLSIEFSTHPIRFRPWRRQKVTKGRPTPMIVTVGLRKGGKEQLGLVSSIRVCDATSGEYLDLLLIPKKPRSPAKLVMQIGRRKYQMSGHVGTDKWQFAREFRKALGVAIKALGGSAPPARRAAFRRIYQMCSTWNFEGFMMGTQRVSSGRSSPQRWYPLSGAPDQRVFGPYRSRFDSVDPTLIEAARETESRRKARGARIEKFLSTLDIGTRLDAYRLSPYHSAIRVTDNRTGVKSNLIDIGYGASQIIPVLAACQSESTSPLFVEQPEIHLHPRAQGDVAELLIDTSRKRQVFVETHSVHLINRARLRIAKGKLSPKDVTVLYVHRDRKGSHVLHIPILDNGDFGVEWPEGFFEERYKDTMNLLDAQNKTKA